MAAPEDRTLIARAFSITLAVVCVIVVGVSLATQLLYISELRQAVSRLQSKVCAYQQATIEIDQALVAAGHEPVRLPPEQSCPPP